jgi:beta-lactamase regulating signal transducer with metallopeptidase domain
MQQSFMDILLTDAVAKAVCWTLVHSLWQGLLAALVAGAVILTTRKSAAVLRYNLLTADLVLFLAAAVGTFACELRAGEGATPVGVVVVDGVQAVAGKVAIHARYAVGAPSMIEHVGVFLNEHAGVVVMLWMVCLLVQLLRMTGGLYRIHQLRRRRVFLPSEFWRERMVVLMERLGIDKKVALLQSGSVTMPVTFGFLKPSILVPLGLLANLPAGQVETILLHELAHIRRSDYLANLLLHIGEAVFFFNPGVRWVAWLVRQEREACCDDLVLAGTRDRNSYFEALIAFGEYRIGKGSMALPLGGGKSDLLWRIRRMLNQENKKLHLMEKTILSFGLMAVLAIGLVSMKGAGTPGAVLDSARPVLIRVSGGTILDTVPAASGKKPASAVKAPVAVEAGLAPGSEERQRSGGWTTGDSAATIKVTTRSETVSALVAPVVSTTSVTERSASVRASSSVAQMSAPLAAIAPVTDIRTQVAATIAPVTTIKISSAATIAPVTTIKTRVAAVVDPETGITGPTATVVPAAPVPVAVAPSTDNSTCIDQIIADLKARGLIQSEDHLSFRLDIHELKVNGVREPDEIYQAFKAKYFNNSKNFFRYNHNGGSVSSETGFITGESLSAYENKD